MKSLLGCGFVFFVFLWAGCAERGDTRDDKKPLVEKALPPMPSSPPAELLTLGGPEYTDLKGRDPDKILAEHLEGDNLSEAQRLYVRTFLARHHPKSPAGLFALAWLYDYGGDKGSALALYRACIEADPTVEVCTQNYLSSLEGFMQGEPPEVEDKAILEMWEAAKAIIPDLVESSPGIFENVFSTLNDRDKAEAIFEAEALRHPDLYVFDLERADEALKAEDHEEAERLYRSAAFERVGADAAVYRKLINHVYEHRSDRKLQPEARLAPIVEEVLKHLLNGEVAAPVKARILYDAALVFKKKTQDKRTITALMGMSFKAYPTEEAILAI